MALFPRRLASGALTLLSCVSPTAYALYPLITEDAGTQGAGGMQIEVSAAQARDRKGDSTTRQLNPAVALTYGVVDMVDVFVAIPYLQLRSAGPGDAARSSGWSDPKLGIKWRFYEQGNLSVAIVPAVIFPLGDATRGLGHGRAGYTLPLVLTRQWDGFAFHTDLEATDNRNTVGERAHLWHASLAIERQFSERLIGVLDVGVDRNPDPQRNLNPAYLLGGVVYSFGRMDVSAGFKGKLNSAAPDQTFLLGLTWHGE
jgi:hypothetical protein